MGNYIDIEDNIIDDVSLLKSITNIADDKKSSEDDRNQLHVQRRRDLEERLDLKRMLDDF